VAARFSEGRVQVYTGAGKGKTTAALGLALRALGHGFSVYLIQFMKGDPDYGELRAIEKLTNFTFKQCGRPNFVDREHPAEEDVRLAQEGLAHAREVVLSGQYDLVILDEINVALDFGLISVADVLALIREKPRQVELVFTGRHAPQEVIEAADLVTEMKEVKHYYRQGGKARDGIEH
jgi:cob(I)alamin adenosyltransferase